MKARKALEALGDDGRAELLRLRPDLARPRSTSLRELAERAVHPSSLSLALRAFDVPALQVTEALAALGPGADRAALERLLGIAPGASGQGARQVLDGRLDLLRRSLFLQVGNEPRLLPEIVAAWPAPLGLGPPAAELLAPMPVTALRQGLAAVGVRTSRTLKADLLADLLAALADPAVVLKTLDQAPPAAAARIREAAHGRPLPPNYLISPYTVDVRGPAGTAGDPTLWAVRHVLAVTTYGAVEMPAEVARAIRGPDWHVAFTHEEPVVLWSPRPEQAVRRDASASAGQAVRTVTGLVEALGRKHLQRLKNGAVGVRELRRLAKEQGTGVGEVRLALALAFQAGLIEPSFHGVRPTPHAKDFLGRSPAQRAAELMTTWIDIPYLPMLDDRGAWQPYVDEWLLDVKGAVLLALVAHPGQAASADELIAWLTWRHHVLMTRRLSAFDLGDADGPPPDPWDDTDDEFEPSDADPHGTDELLHTVLAEAAWLGVVADGALTGLGSQAIAGDAVAVAAALEDDLGVAATRARLQADLTAVVMGHPAAELSAVLDELATREARSVATTWRFSPATIRQALDDGWTADLILDRLGQLADGPVPQPLTYLVNDAGRRHGHLRGGTATCYLRGDDEALLREVAADRRLVKLGLRLLGPGVLVGDRPLEETLSELRKAGYAPVPEDRSGHRITTGRSTGAGAARRGIR